MNPILQYAQALQQHGLNSDSVKKLYEQYKKEKGFVERAEVLHKLKKAKSVPLGSAHAVR